MSRKRSGFTLIELLIVIAIIGILIASIAVAVTKAKEFANNSDQKNNLKQLTTAIRVAEGFNNNRMPPAWGTYNMPPKGATAVVVRNTFTHLLPNLENKPLFDAPTTALAQANIRVFQSAMDPSALANPVRRTSFVANIRVFSSYGQKQTYNAGFALTSLTSANTATADAGGVMGSDKIADGASNTIFFGTRYMVCQDYDNLFDLYPYYATSASATNVAPFFGAGQYGLPPSETASAAPWPSYQISPSLSTTATNACAYNPGIFGQSFGSTPMAVAMGDTSVRNLTFTISGETYARALCPTDGNPLGSDW